MSLPTEPIGSIPRPPSLLEAIARHGSEADDLEPLYHDAIRDTIARFEATGSPVITDGEQRKYHNFWTYSVHELPNTVLAPIDPRVETPEKVRDRTLRAARRIPPNQLGTTDDCGFAPFSDDDSTSRDTAFAKIRARVLGSDLAAEALGLR